MTCNQDAFPAMLQVETAAVSESQVLDQKEAADSQPVAAPDSRS